MMNNVFSLSDDEVRALDLYWRAANYLGARRPSATNDKPVSHALKKQPLEIRATGHTPPALFLGVF